MVSVFYPQGGSDPQADGGGGERPDAIGGQFRQRPAEDRPPLHHLRRLLPRLQHPGREGVRFGHLRLQVGTITSEQIKVV